MATKIKFSFSGVGANPKHDGTMSVNYFYMVPEVPETFPKGKTPYTELLEAASKQSIYANFTNMPELNIRSSDGVLTNTSNGTKYSVYKREYQVFEKELSILNADVSSEAECATYAGPWTPVALLIEEPFIRDFNVTSGRSYQYVVYPYSYGGDSLVQIYANVDQGEDKSKAENSAPVLTNWDEWSITELIPVETPVDAPIIKKAYRADINNTWLFKYSLQTGEQTQNFQKQDIQTLGQYNKFGYGQQNFVSGNVSGLLGSEIVPYSKYAYIERRRQSIKAPLSTNEKVELLRQWRRFAFSPNPKLLKDIKGQSWIVQIVSSSNSPQNFYANQPDTISFSWKEMSGLDHITIIGDGSEELPKPGQCNSIWKGTGKKSCNE